MELYQIRSFIAVADALNLTRAARETHQSPSAVSSQIKALETGLGVTLFKRGPKGMSLTPDGETLLASARTLDQACPFHRAFQKRLDREGLSLTATADAVDENIVEELVKSGTGAALMREDHAIKLVDRGRAVFWDDPGMEIPLAMACLRHRKDEKAVSAFFRAVQQFKGIPLSCEHPR